MKKTQEGGKILNQYEIESLKQKEEENSTLQQKKENCSQFPHHESQYLFNLKILLRENNGVFLEVFPYYFLIVNNI